MMPRFSLKVDVGEAAHGNRKRGVFASLRGGNDDIGHAHEFLFHCSVIFLLFLRHVSFLSFGYVSRLFQRFQSPESFASRWLAELSPDSFSPSFCDLVGFVAFVDFVFPLGRAGTADSPTSSGSSSEQVHYRSPHNRSKPVPLLRFLRR